MILECLNCDRDFEGIVCPHCGFDSFAGVRQPDPIDLNTCVGIYLRHDADRPKLMAAARKAGVDFVDTQGRRNTFRLSDGNGSRHRFYLALQETGIGYYMLWRNNPDPPQGGI